MPPPESGSPLILVGFAVFNRRVMQLASRGECDRARAGRSLVDLREGSFFFFWYFRKKLRARATRNKENNNCGLRPELPQLKSQHALCSINIAVGVVLFGNHNRQLLRAHYRVPEIFLECATKERKEMPGERRSEGRLFHNKMLI